MIVYAAKTDVGKKREMNQDYFIVSEEKPQLFVLCDGMGGHNSGDVASRAAAASIENYVRLQSALDYDAQKAKRVLKGALSYANKIVYTRAVTSPKLSGMGTTADVCMVDFDTVYIAHVGDSRVYLLRDKTLCQLTRDHSLVAEMVERGLITEAEALGHPKKNVITRAVGTNQTVEADFLTTDFVIGDMILMCSDGLSNMLSKDEMQSILLEEEDGETIVEHLISRANEKGGKDNITAILMQKIAKEEA